MAQFIGQSAVIEHYSRLKGFEHVKGKHHAVIRPEFVELHKFSDDGHHDFVGWSKTANGAIITNGDFGTMTTAGAKFYAIWQIHSNTLAWNANGGNALTGSYTSGTVDYGTAITAPNTPTRTGYTFMGWATTPDGTPTSVEGITMPDDNLTYYAIWQVNQHTIAWNANGGDALTGDYTSGSVDFGTAIAKPADPTRTGYDFAGWNTSASATTAITTAETMPDNDLTYYAVWEAHTHQLTWYPNGGEFTGTDPSGLVAFGTAIETPLVNRTDWKMAGWGLTADATPNDVVTPAPSMPDNDLTYYAVWILKTNYVTWKQNYNTDDDLNYTSTSVEVGDPIIAPTGTPTREHYHFIGWSATRDGAVIGNGDFGTMDTNKKEFYAQWEINSNMLSWNANGGEIITSGTTGTVEYGAPLTPATVERVGYTFKGWGTSPAAAEADAVEITTMPDAATEYFAIWTANPYDVTWMYNNGTNETFAVTTATFDGEITAPATNPARDFYTFAGWAATPESEVISDFGTLTTEGATFYAKWNLKKFSLAWDANGGELSGDYTQGDVEYGTIIVQPTATKENYIFAGWATIANPDSVVTITTMPDSSMTLVANWIADYYVVEWRMNDGTDQNYKATNVDYGNQIEAPAENPERPNYQFAGWAAEADGNITTDFGTMTSTHAIFYAQWQINTHTLSWNANGGDTLTGNCTSGTVEVGTAIVAPTATRTGYTFNGWNTYAEAVDSISISTMPDNDVEYFAVWKIKTCLATWYYTADSVFATTNMKYADTVKIPVAPTRTGYNLVGWNNAAGVALDSAGTITADTAFYAIWEEKTELNKYAVVWYYNDGTNAVFRTDSLAQGDSIIAPVANLERAGHQFLGWSAQSTGTLISDFGTATTDTAFYAIWIKNKYQITWMLNQTDTLKTELAAYGDAINAPADNPEREQYQFKGWATAENSGTAITDFGTVGTDTTFYAIWEEIVLNKYAAVWYYNDGTTAAFETTMIEEGATISAPAGTPTRDDYEFKGWATATDGSVTTSFGKMTNTGAAFYAIWEALVSFDAPENYSTCESGFDHIQLTNINNDKVVFEWEVNGDTDSTQTDGYFEFTDEMALSGIIKVTGILGSTRVTKTISYQRNKEMLRTMWDDIITVVNGKGYFESYRWYHNGALIDTTDMCYEPGGLTGIYQLVATTTSGEVITSCEMSFGAEPLVTAINVYPNPARYTAVVESEGIMRIRMYSMKGQLLQEINGNGDDSVEISLRGYAPAPYLLEVVTRKGLARVKLNVVK